MKPVRKKLIGLAILLVFLVSLGMAGKIVYRGVRQPELNNALIAAVKKNDTAAVVALLREEADANARDLPSDTRSMWWRVWDILRGKHLAVGPSPTALVVALDTDDGENFPPENVPLVRALLDRGARVNTSGECGPYVCDSAPLLLAAEGDKQETVRLLLDRGANVRAKDSAGHTALFWAVDKSDPAMVKLLLARGSLVNVIAADGTERTPLHIAALNRRADVLRLLLASGGDINAREHDDTTPLADAVMCGDTACVKLLLEKGANVNDKDSTGKSLLRSAQENGYAEVVQMLKKAGAKE
jgi:hypothetical protein